jgi:uncharacterized protein (DUF362 family)
VTKPAVGVVRCDARASDEEVQKRLFAAASHLGDLGRLFAGKRKIFVKSNLGIADVRYHLGRQVALTDRAVVRAAIALIREHFSGELLLGDATTDGPCARVYKMVGLDEALAPFDVRQIEPNEPPYVEVAVPGTPLMFSRYQFSAELMSCDAFVSLAKLKSHLSAGATLCLKNLFGLPPTPVYGRPRRYLHAPIRLPRAIADEGQIFRPILNVIDGLVGQDDREWHGGPVETNLLLVGDNCLATDATAMRLMGMDPELDYGRFPFNWDANALKLAASVGVGQIAESEIDVRGDSLDGLGKQFHVARELTPEIDAVRRSTAEQAGVYVERRAELLASSAGRIVALANGDVLMTVDSMNDLPPRAELAERLRGNPNAGVFVKRVEPAEVDPERLDVYAEVLAQPALF